MVSDGSQDLRELSGQVVQVQRAHARQVSPQVSMDPRALDADQRTQVQTGPRGICRARRREPRSDRKYVTQITESKQTLSVTTPRAVGGA